MRSSFWKALRCVSATVPLWCAGVAAEDAGPTASRESLGRRYESTEGGFRVAFGKTPKILARKVATPAGDLTLHSAVVESERGSWSVNWTHYPDSHLYGRAAEAVVEEAVGRMLQAGGWRVERRASVPVGRWIGTEVELLRPASPHGPALRAVARACLVDDRLFQVLAVWRDGSTLSGMMRSFIVSFEPIARGGGDAADGDAKAEAEARLVQLDPDRLRDAGAAPRAGAARIKSFAFVGEDRDRVGRDGPDAGRPNGEPDLHFRVEIDLPPRSTIEAMSLSSGPVCRWVTVPNDRYWLLGVASGGASMAPGYMRSLGPFEGRQTFDLYGQGDFRAEDRFHLAVALTVGGRPVAIVAECSRAKPPADATLTSFEWLDEDDDRVGENDPVRSGPNGKDDQHWRVATSLPEGAVVESVAVTQPGSLNRWQTKPDGHWWPLGVFRGDEALAVGHVEKVGPLGGDQVLDLYANTGFPIESGAHFVVEMVVNVDGRACTLTRTCDKP